MLNEDVAIDPGELNLDLKNPRMPDAEFLDQSEAVQYLADHADVSELVQSIATSGWYDYEPLIVLRGENVVLEGNRRLAALRLIADPDLAKSLGVAIPEPLHANAKPDEVRIRFVDHPREARDFIGFKHINGAFKWDSLAKAKYAAQWLDDDGEINTVSQRLGDNHNTISRLVNGWKVLQQAEANGFDREAISRRTFAFSHLYTAISRPATREYLGLPDVSEGLLGKDPVPRASLAELGRFTSWLYGQKDEPAVIQSQNPDLGHLVQVLGNKSALATLEATRNLDRAYDIAEDKTTKFSALVYKLVQDVEEALRLSGSYDGDPALVGVTESISRSARVLSSTVKAGIAEDANDD
ncbi:hypothetical protein C5B96_16665 [Subtercola sp. Z020]|uniref:hypothetical protein n=1 Tax=Subtercola sp. Z020 TaxID=2080582 RepID=UPI000CE8C3B0|nr:hypothetical protein [Subtercola sp. Z020]PPF75479.1 hypothetical protein C5B96_16665 [Subtercola sp. Z020]